MLATRPSSGWDRYASAPGILHQGFGLGGVIATFGLVLDGIGFVLLLIFVLVSSVLLPGRESAVPSTSGGD